MNIRHSLYGGLLILAVSAIAAQSDQERAISASIGKMRSMPDAERAKATLEAALQIRKLNAGKSKVNLASGLCNLATEGDFGHDTLQEVANTLTMALAETPLTNPQVRMPAGPYLQLANLERFEGIKVTLEGQSMHAARVTVKNLEESRSKVDFTLTDLDGKKWTLSQLKGKIVLVNFWATWCPPCRKEMPDLETLHKRYREKGLVVIAISDEDDSKVRPFIVENKYTFPVLLDPGRKVNEEYQVDGIPKTFIYNREGKLAAQSIDMRTMGQFLALLKKAGLNTIVR
ncbi:MAG: TlpA disulfide reductase family protein [Fimbriimonadaceae bacterium]